MHPNLEACLAGNHLEAKFLELVTSCRPQYQELKPGEKFLGQVASTLRSGTYTRDGRYLGKG
jgi:hypothetical protein